MADVAFIAAGVDMVFNQNGIVRQSISDPVRFSTFFNSICQEPN
jgi:hypothetical protein